MLKLRLLTKTQSWEKIQDSFFIIHCKKITGPDCMVHSCTNNIQMYTNKNNLQFKAILREQLLYLLVKDTMK